VKQGVPGHLLGLEQVKQTRQPRQVAGSEAEMANMDLGYGAEAVQSDSPGAFSTLFNWLGAVMSVALVAGLAVWGYQLAMRDVTGVPVVRALEGPMRVAPDDPGGEQAAYQGLAVNSVAADGSAAGPVDRLVLAPEPLDLSDADQPRPRLARTANSATNTVTPAVATDTLALADDVARDATPLVGSVETAETGVRVVPASVAGVSVSPLPSPRPLGDLTAQAVANTVAFASSGNTNNAAQSEIDAATVPVGTRLVQFGAFDSPEAARGEWNKLDARFTDFLRGKSRVVQRAESGGKTFYRLRAMGFADINDARRFCSAMLAERQACIPVVTR